MIVDRSGELKKVGRRLTALLVRLYLIGIAILCFLPQWVYPNPKEHQTPGMVQVGRLYFLPTPLNTLVHGDKIDNLEELFWVVMQNVSNIFLLFPLVLGMVFLSPDWRSWKVVLRNSFLMSLFIESTQLVLDGLFDAQRVFEIDDLWTNSLGGLLAYGTWLSIRKWITEKHA